MAKKQQEVLLLQMIRYQEYSDNDLKVILHIHIAHSYLEYYIEKKKHEKEVIMRQT